VFVEACGCPCGLVEGSYAKTMDRAWDMFAYSRADERRMRDEGVTCVHVSHEEYEATYYRRMKAGCSHRPVAAAALSPDSLPEEER
jgi:hypothetical protein